MLFHADAFITMSVLIASPSYVLQKAKRCYARNRYQDSYDITHQYALSIDSYHISNLTYKCAQKGPTQPIRDSPDPHRVPS